MLFAIRVLLIGWLVMLVGVAHAEPPEAVARKLVTAQLDALADPKDYEAKALEQWFAPEAVVMGPNNDMGAPKIGLVTVRPSVRGRDVNVDGASIASLVAGGDGKMIWISAELEFVTSSMYKRTGPKSTHTIRLTEIAAFEGGTWRVLAAVFAIAGTPKRDKDPPQTIVYDTKPDTLARLLVSPQSISNNVRANDATVVVYGTEKTEKAVGGAAAKKLVESWKSLRLEIDGKVREVVTDNYGFIQANVNWVKPGGLPYRMKAILIATRNGRSDPWTIRAIQFAIP